MRFNVLLLTYNEYFHIGSCLDSIKGADRVVAVDSGSTDGTLEVMMARGIEIVSHPFETFSQQRNFGMEHFFEPEDWVLHLDADERIDKKLIKEIRQLKPGREVAWNIASLTYFRGKPIPRASGFPVYQTRLTRAWDFRFVEVGHGQKAPVELGTLKSLKNPYHHFPFEKGLSDWIHKHDRYSTREAVEWLENRSDYPLSQAFTDPIARRQWLKQLLRDAPMYPWIVYTYLMFLRRGILDGQAGREYCRRRLIYEMMVQMKVREERYRDSQAEDDF